MWGCELWVGGAQSAVHLDQWAQVTSTGSVPPLLGRSAARCSPILESSKPLRSTNRAPTGCAALPGPRSRTPNRGHIEHPPTLRIQNLTHLRTIRDSTMAGLPPAVAAAIGEGSITALNDALPPGFDLRAFWRWQNPRTGTLQQRTLLHVAAHHAAVELVLALLNAGCDVNAPAPDDGFTALHCACAAATSSSSARTIAALLRAGADREARCALGRTPCELLSLEAPSVSRIGMPEGL